MQVLHNLWLMFIVPPFFYGWAIETFYPPFFRNLNRLRMHNNCSLWQQGRHSYIDADNACVPTVIHCLLSTFINTSFVLAR